MSGGGFEIQPLVLGQSSMIIGGICFEMDDALGTLQQNLYTVITLNGEGSPFGGDTIGLEASRAYSDGIVEVYPRMKDYRDQVAYGARELDGACIGFASLNRTGAELMSDLGKQIPGRPG